MSYNEEIVEIDNIASHIQIHIVAYIERIHSPNEYSNYLETTASVISLHV